MYCKLHIAIAAYHIDSQQKRECFYHQGGQGFTLGFGLDVADTGNRASFATKTAFTLHFAKGGYAQFGISTFNPGFTNPDGSLDNFTGDNILQQFLEVAAPLSQDVTLVARAGSNSDGLGLETGAQYDNGTFSSSLVLGGIGTTEIDHYGVVGTIQYKF